MKDRRFAPKSLLALVLCLSMTPAFGDGFVDVTTQAGLGYLQHDLNTPPDCLLFFGSFCEPERMSGGAAVGDVDGDEWPDLFVTRLDRPSMLFRNNGDGTFSDITSAAGLDLDIPANGAGFADIENDGDLDLYVTTIGGERFYLFVNDGTGQFSEQGVERGADVASNSTRVGYSVSFGDYDLDGYVDIHTTEWRPFFVARRAPSHARLLRNRGADAPGFFEDVTDAAGVDIQRGSLGGHWAFASVFSDLDGDDYPDLAIASDFGSSRLFWNAGDGTFVEGTVEAGVGTDENGMGSTIADYDGDGRLDWFVTSIYDPENLCETYPCNWGTTGNRLYRNEGGRVFSDATDEAGVRNGWWGWGAAFFDYDNDGDQDLTMTNGVDFPGLFFDTPFPTDPMFVWRNDGQGRFDDATQELGIFESGSGKGLLTFDYDRDGDLDLFIVNNGTTPRLLENRTDDGNDWLRIDPIGTRSNRQSLGAVIEVLATPTSLPQMREVGSSSHFLGQGETTAHFGLGRAGGRVWQVKVRWPASGAELVFRNVPANRVYSVPEPAKRSERPRPVRFATPR